MDSPLDVTTTGGVQVWTLNQTETGNAITDLSFVEAIERAVDEANDNLEVRAIVLTGAGKHFSSGGNVKEMADGEGMFGLDERAQRRAYIAGIQRVPRALQRLEVPIIAAVNGAAVGGGAALAMACDIAVASDKARYFFAFGRLGAAACDMGCSYRARVYASPSSNTQ